MAGKGYTGGRRVKGDLFRNNFDNIDFSSGKGELTTEEAIDILGITGEDFISSGDSLEDVDRALRALHLVDPLDGRKSEDMMEAVEEGKDSSEWSMTPPVWAT